MYGQGVTCIGATDFPSQLSNQSSQLYANNVSSLMQSFGAKGYFHMVSMSDGAGLTRLPVMAAFEQQQQQQQQQQPRPCGLALRMRAAVLLAAVFV